MENSSDKLSIKKNKRGRSENRKKSMEFEFSDYKKSTS